MLHYTVPSSFEYCYSYTAGTSTMKVTTCYFHYYCYSGNYHYRYYERRTLLFIDAIPYMAYEPRFCNNITTGPCEVDSTSALTVGSWGFGL